MKKGGAAKGELVLAIFELANCFRHGWGVEVDKVAAKQVRVSKALVGASLEVHESNLRISTTKLQLILETLVCSIYIHA